MRKIWLLTTLLIWSLLLTGCNKTVVENCWDDCINESDIDVLEHKCMEYVNKALFDNIEETPNPTAQYFYDNSWSIEYTFTDVQFLWTYYWIKWYAKAWDKSQNFICNIYTGWWLHDLYFYNDKSNNEEPVVNIDHIDTEEERKERCKDDAMKQFNEIIPDWEFVNLVWEGLEKETRDESWRLTIIHWNFRIVYNKDWYEWFWPWLCETNFVEWNQKVIFNQSYMNI